MSSSSALARRGAYNELRGEGKRRTICALFVINNQLAACAAVGASRDNAAAPRRFATHRGHVISSARNVVEAIALAARRMLEKRRRVKLAPGEIALRRAARHGRAERA